jgi:hypothetical protein
MLVGLVKGLEPEAWVARGFMVMRECEVNTYKGGSIL